MHSLLSERWMQLLFSQHIGVLPSETSPTSNSPAWITKNNTTPTESTALTYSCCNTCTECHIALPLSQPDHQNHMKGKDQAPSFVFFFCGRVERTHLTSPPPPQNTDIISATPTRTHLSIPHLLNFPISSTFLLLHCLCCVHVLILTNKSIHSTHSTQ